ncbi:MAG TPA: hypothetical protein VNS12_03655 [Pelagibacterium sp.]|uniref:hypothetical protein n=1 Tax=Pelagibacterium sp. TaxID=1967288 RepID=UPI002BECFA2A|nr:hypothetical protein [Pelagibacterium sp.]HWJ87152.1 hypothetical protein [Pelagibacterium sp.]
MVNVNSRSSTSRTAHSAPTAGSALYLVAIIALAVAIAALLGAYGLRAWFDRLDRAEPLPALAAVHIVTIGPQPYIVPAALLADPSQRRDGFAERIDLVLALPLAAGGKFSDVAVTITPRGRTRTSAALLDSVYLHQFSDAQLSGPPGLVGKPLTADPGTVGETVWYDPLSPNPFVAKCMTPVSITPGARTCIRVMALSDRNTAIVSFDPEALDTWRQFDTRIEDALAALRK